MMEFVVSRASAREGVSPCEGAQKFEYEYVLNSHFNIIENRVGWTIGIQTLDDLMNFNETHGDLIIQGWYADKTRKEIVIYDSYVE